MGTTIHTLARMQQRAHYWEKAAENGASPELKRQMRTHLKRYQSLMTKTWQAGTVSAEESTEIDNLERLLEALTEEIRLTPGQIPVGKENYQKYL